MFYKRLIGSALMMAALSSTAGARVSHPGAAPDGMRDETHAFAGAERKERYDRKQSSFWRRPAENDAAAQLDLVRDFFARGKYRRAARAADALVRAWHDSPEAVEAQRLLARAYEEGGRYRRAFEAYRYLIDFFAGRFPYEAAVEGQFAIADKIYARMESRRFFGGDRAEVRDLFRQILRNAPQGARAAESQMKIGLLYEEDGKDAEAIMAYEQLLSRYPRSPEAPMAAFYAARCRYRMALRYGRDETLAIQALSSVNALLREYPDHPERAAIAGYAAELHSKLAAHHFERAVFYDRVRRNPAAARIAYAEFLRRFPDDPLAEKARRRLTEIPEPSGLGEDAGRPEISGGKKSRAGPDDGSPMRDATRRPSDDR